MIELLFAAVVGVGTAAATASFGRKTKEARLLSARQFERELTRHVTTGDERCDFCGDKLTPESTRIIYPTADGEGVRFVCNKTSCVLRYTRAQAAALPAE